MKYGDKEISEIRLWDLGVILENMKNAQDRRERASRHVKFNEDREINGKKVKKLDFPPINPEFLKLMEAIELEIEKRQNV